MNGSVAASKMSFGSAVRGEGSRSFGPDTITRRAASSGDSPTARSTPSAAATASAPRACASAAIPGPARLPSTAGAVVRSGVIVPIIAERRTIDQMQTAPVSIHADRGAGRLEIVWDDGHETAYDTTTLRWLCPCAFCRGEAGMPGWLDSGPTLTDEQTRLVDVAMVGGYAIAPTWGDGHHTGYYTFTLLRDRCPCPTCTSRRASTAPVAPAASIGSTRHEEHA